MSVLVLDYGMGNLASARRALEECGARVVVSSDPDDVREVERIVVPGVGAFTQAMDRLTKTGWTEALRHAALVDRLPILGVCLGMQLLASRGEEGGTTLGLDLIPGTVLRMVPATEDERIPHVGWNNVEIRSHSALFEGITSAADFYFVHSYHFSADSDADVMATTPYCGSIAAAVGRDNVMGVQFHPEKSSRAGFRLLQNFLGFKC